MADYNACVVSTLLYGSTAWTTYSKQERKLNSFHPGSLRRILGISWRDKVSNTEVLDRTGLSTMYILLSAGLAMCAAWRMAEYLRTSSMENLPLANDPVATQSLGTRMSAKGYESLGNRPRELERHCGRPQQLALPSP